MTPDFTLYGVLSGPRGSLGLTSVSSLHPTEAEARKALQPAARRWPKWDHRVVMVRPLETACRAALANPDCGTSFPENPT